MKIEKEIERKDLLLVKVLGRRNGVLAYHFTFKSVGLCVLYIIYWEATAEWCSLRNLRFIFMFNIAIAENLTRRFY